MSLSLPDYCLIGDNAVTTWYDDLIASSAISPDKRQAAAVGLLQEFADKITAESPAADSKDNGLVGKLRSWLGNGEERPTTADAGLYFYGGVGRGKSFLMDGFYLQLPLERKLRVHFHQFMRHLHADMKARENDEDPLAHVAADLGRRFDLICFDEFHVSDITDAMLLGRLLDILLTAGVRFVMTTNYPPAGLYPNGLARDRFLPTIALLEARLQVFSLDGDKDYRQRHLSNQPIWFSPSDDTKKTRMRDIFNRLACGIILQRQIKLNHRDVPVIARTSDCVWFDFQSLCVAARSKEDYLQLAERYATIFLSDVPCLNNPDLTEAARRFTWLVDVLYDQKINLIIAAAEPLGKLYGGAEGGESGRTLSRLTEMQSVEYLRKATHLS